jgi:hypothetical protein
VNRTVTARAVWGECAFCEEWLDWGLYGELCVST